MKVSVGLGRAGRRRRLATRSGRPLRPNWTRLMGVFRAGVLGLVGIHCATPSSSSAVDVDRAAKSGPSAEASLAEAERALSERPLSERRLGDVVRLYDAVLDRHPERSEALYNRAWAQYQLGQLEEARAGFEAVLALEPASVDAVLNLGGVLRAQGALTEAVEVTQAGLTHRPFDPRLLKNLSVLEWERGHHKTAVEALQKLLMRHEQDPDALKNLSLVFLDNGEVDLAETVVRRALKAAEDDGRRDPDLWVNLGMVYLARGEPTQAMVAFQRAVEIDSAHPAAHYNIAGLALKHRDYRLAASSYARVGEAWGKRFDVALAEGYALQGLGKPLEAVLKLEEARKLLEESSSATPQKKRELLDQLVVVYQAADRPADALRCAREYMSEFDVECSDEDVDGFCGRYNGIRLTLEMEAEGEPVPTSVEDTGDSDRVAPGE